MYYPEELIEEVRQKNDIVDVISGYVRIKQKGSNQVERAGVKLPEAEYDENTRRQVSRRAKMLALNKDAATYFFYQLRAPQGETGLKYFKDRQCAEET